MTTEPQMSGEEFLAAVTAALTEGVKNYRNDRAQNPGLSEGDFLRQFGTELAELVHHGVASVEQVAYTAAAALHRLASLEDAAKVAPFNFQPPSFLDPIVRYIVLGNHSGIEHWRRQQQLPRRDVIAVTSSDDLRGHGPGRYKLVTLASWKPTRETAADVRESLRAMKAQGAVIER